MWDRQGEAVCFCFELDVQFSFCLFFVWVFVLAAVVVRTFLSFHYAPLWGITFRFSLCPSFDLSFDLSFRLH